MAQIERIEAAKGEFVSVATEWLVKEINKYISADDECILGLSGGTLIECFLFHIIRLGEILNICFKSHKLTFFLSLFNSR